MATEKFTREYMLDVLYEESGEIISDTIIDTSRWSEHHELIFKVGDRFYRAYYSRGLTEMQDESPWEYEKEVTAVEVEPVEVTVVQYQEVQS